MFTRILSSALIAGAGAGLIAALLQLAFVQPVLLEAELYEGGERIHFTGAPATGHHHEAPEAPLAGSAPAPAEAHSHDAPADPAQAAAGGHGALTGIQAIDWTRDGLSILFSIVVYVGYALLLVSALALAEERGHRVKGVRAGLLWGLAGFVAVQFAPAFGLPPELPGMAAADVGLRAIWWVATVAATAVGLWLVALGRGWPAIAGGVVLIALPHLVGAPHPEAFAGPTPPELASLFAGRALGVGLIAWALLGLFAAGLWTRRPAAAA